MPRPGLRQYECVRRPWHSDGHQPMRGSIIQQIFKVVNETHSATTRKNKEWQEKLPVVVLKAEEIMYSKANSEAEYMNPDTLWDRVNDAINSIIRRDESSETGELLPPCVEAALNLGCIPFRASRSQRHNIPRSYLSAKIHKPVSGHLRVLENPNDIQCSQLSPLQSSCQFGRATMALTSMPPVSESNLHVNEMDNLPASCSFPTQYEICNPSHGTLMSKETSKKLNLGLVYPKYYGKDYHVEQLCSVSRVLEKISETVIVGTPISSSAGESPEMGNFWNSSTCPCVGIAAKRISRSDSWNMHEKPPWLQCDLSLRLGQSTDPCTLKKRSSV